MRVLTSILALLLLCTVSLQAQTDFKTVIGEGGGETQSEALDAALRDAVEKTVGIVIGSETLVQNYQLISDEILSQSKGFVRSYDVVKEWREDDGSFMTRVSAEVGAITEGIASDRMTVEILLRWVQKPRVLVLIEESNLGDADSRIAEATIAGKLVDLGFTVIDRNAVNWEQARQRVASGELAALSEGVDVDLVVAGTAKATEGVTPEVMKNAGHTSVQATLTARLFRTDTGTLLSVENANDASYHINPNTAGAVAIEEAAKTVIDKVIAEVIQTWAMQRSNTTAVTVVIREIGFRQQIAFVEALKEHRLVRDVAERGLEGGTFEALVDLKGQARDLALDLDGFSAEGSTWTVGTLTPRKIVLMPK